MDRRRKRAVAYVRVSTASSAQLHSYEFQEQYWHDKLDSAPYVELVHIYADLGISGSSMDKRPQLLAMMRDARAGKFDIIYTKSVSRFARNTIELLEAVRELRDIGVEVVFEKENIRSSDPTSELMLTVAATIAEDDLKVDSERQRWSFKRRFENGWISIGNGMYGYRMLEDNTLEIVPEEAAVVRRIFEMYINGAGSSMIAATLDREGIPSRIGKGWRPQTILEMLANEKYMGDSLMGKSVTINGRQFDNMNGEYGQRYYMEDTHEGIISKETFALVQELRLQRKNRKLVGQPIPEYPFTGIIECGECGKHYQHKVNNSGKKWQNDIWCCATSLKKGVAVCCCTRIKDSVLRDKFIEAYNEFVTQRPQGDNIAALQSVVSGLKKEESELAALRMQRLITEAGFRAEQRRIKTKITELTAKINEQRSKEVTESDYTTITEFDEAKVAKFITKVIVRRWMVTFVFYNGAKITRAYSNGQAGNKPGWNKKKEVV